MRARCTNKNDASYKYYGERGITIGAEWSDSKVFFSDMSNVPAGLSLDRIVANGNYRKSNCRWTEPTQQTRNKTNTSWLTYDGETLSIKAWAERIGLTVSAVWWRINNGWSVERSLTTPSMASRNVWRGKRLHLTSGTALQIPTSRNLTAMYKNYDKMCRYQAVCGMF